MKKSMGLHNPARERLLSNLPALGVNVRIAPTPEIARLMGAVGYHWLFLDLEHSSMSLESASRISIASLDCGIASIVRVPSGEYSMATRALDGGALGVVMPHVATASKARELVQRVKYPPLGSRSISSTIPHFLYAPTDPGELTAALNATVLTIAMVETIEGIENSDAIADTIGIDIVMVGASDLCLDLGVRDAGTPEFRSAITKVASACKLHGKHLGVGGLKDEARILEATGLGAAFILLDSDVGLLMSAARARIASLNNKFGTK
jgi:4-hydroxy-2-oxoheptanedioate aldolase